MVDDPENEVLELPGLQYCRKYGASFRLKPNPSEKASPLVMRVVKPSDTCDWGYGKGS
jgi:hypothetical protein